MGGTKHCYIRPGACEDYCVGSPALDFAKTAAGNYGLDIPAAAGTQWRSLACFNICVDIPPSIGNPATVQ
jgi:hypothetical protein